MRVLLVGNPTAQSGKAEKRIQQALAAMDDRGWEADLLRTLPDGATVDLLRQRLDEDAGIEVVACLGGDGTFAEVAKGLLAAQKIRPLGMLPSGTANDQGKSFGISSAPAALIPNLRVMEGGHTTHLDVGRVERLDAEGRVDAAESFFHSVGWGMQPDILAQRNKDREAVKAFPLLRQIYRDQLVYAGAALEKLLESYVEPSKFDAFVTILDPQRLGTEQHYFLGPSLEGQLHRLTDLVINATPVYGGSWVLDRRSRPDDGVFEMVPVKGRREWARKALLDLRNSPLNTETLQLFGLEQSQSWQGSAFHIEVVHSAGADVPVSSQLDGEEWVPGLRFKVAVQPGLLPVLTPADWSPPWAA